MKNVIGGLIAIILGVFCFTLFFSSFLNFMAGILPLSLIVGGSLILYLKHGEEIANYWNNRGIADDSPKINPSQTEPVVTEPVETEPVVTEPVETEPVVTEPVVTEPVVTEPVVTEPVEKAIEFLGNPSSFVFHSPHCRYSKNGKCTAVFTTREDALQQGYKPCGVCKP
jgi:hypothetical protein